MFEFDKTTTWLILLTAAVLALLWFTICSYVFNRVQSSENLKLIRDIQLNIKSLNRNMSDILSKLVRHKPAKQPSQTNTKGTLTLMRNRRKRKSILRQPSVKRNPARVTFSSAKEKQMHVCTIDHHKPRKMSGQPQLGVDNETFF